MKTGRGNWVTVGESTWGEKKVGTIVLSCKRVMTVSAAKILLKHELVHAIQGCQGKSGNSCEERACMEVQAYFFANCANRQGAARVDCAKEKAVFSIFSGFNNPDEAPCKTREEANAAIEKAAPTCARL